MDMSGTDSSMTSSSSCQISMLWNWTTLDSCFLSSSWHNRTSSQFAGSVLGVFFLVIAIEGVRRLGREFDRRLVLNERIGGGEGQTVGLIQKENQLRITAVQHAVRSVIYGTQFTAAFLVMLLGMYFNGYILFAIFIGHTVGYFIFSRDTFCGNDVAAAGIGCC